MDNLKQIKNFLTVRYYTIKDDGLEIKIRSIINNEDIFVPFHNIGNKLTRITRYNKGILYPSIFFVLAGVFRILVSDDPFIDDSIGFWSFIGFLGSIFSFIFKINMSFLEGGQTVVNLYTDKPNKYEFSIFIKTLITKRDEYLKSKYLNLSPSLDYGTQLENLIALDNLGVISNEKFIEKRQELDEMYKNFPYRLDSN